MKTAANEMFENWKTEREKNGKEMSRNPFAFAISFFVRLIIIFEMLIVWLLEALNRTHCGNSTVRKRKERRRLPRSRLR